MNSTYPFTIAGFYTTEEDYLLQQEQIKLRELKEEIEHIKTLGLSEATEARVIEELEVQIDKVKLKCYQAILNY